MSRAVVWFRADLRLEDNPAWAEATALHEAVTPLFVIDPALWDRVSPRRRAMLAEHLRHLDQRLERTGGRLRVERGDPVEVVTDIAGAAPVYVNRDSTPYAIARDRSVGARVELVVREGGTVHPPGSLLTGAGEVYRVFTPFSKRWFERDLDHWPVPGDAAIAGNPGAGIPDANRPPMPGGEEAALERLARFEERVERYPGERDRPDLDSTARLSIDLKWGTLAARRVVQHIGTGAPARRAFVRQVAWRDFYAHIMFDRPDTVDRALKPAYDAIEWNHDPEAFRAWKEGRTGYPLVDAGMRQLAGEGWMHNRVRMVVASFLTKDLLIDWRRGERWFRHALLDADLAQNVGNWQWVAGTGADAAPYFRIFNPVTQSEKFDPDGVYIRRWVPELAAVPAGLVHAPWRSPLELAACGVSIGGDYPAPIVDHSAARIRAIDRYERALG